MVKYINIFNFQICYGTIDVYSSRRLNVLFPNRFTKKPFVFISPISKGDVICSHYLNNQNAIYIYNVSNNGFMVTVQNKDVKLNEIASKVQYFAIGKG
jgi:hypothetical protein